MKLETLLSPQWYQNPVNNILGPRLSRAHGAQHSSTPNRKEGKIAERAESHKKSMVQVEEFHYPNWSLTRHRSKALQAGDSVAEGLSSCAAVKKSSNHCSFRRED